jgi:hypothetical protein
MPIQGIGNAVDVIQFIRRNKMAKYIRKPIIIEAIKWTVNIDEMMEFLKDIPKDTSFEDSRLKINYPEGTLIAEIGDYIVKESGSKNFQVMKPQVFENLYEEVDEP